MHSANHPDVQVAQSDMWTKSGSNRANWNRIVICAWYRKAPQSEQTQQTKGI